MLRFLLAVVLTAPLFASLPVAASETVLIVVSGEGRDAGKTRPGYEFDELAQAWLIFQANGLRVEVASPQGGAVEADRYDRDAPFNAQLLADASAMAKLAATRRIADLRAEDYAAVYVVGGKGAMFDLPTHVPLQQLLAAAWEHGAVVAAVCHGPAALVPVTLADGSRLVRGRRITGFSNEEETVFGKKWAKQFPWLLEDALRGQGAEWSEAVLMMPHVVVDGHLVTGQNPYSTPAVAEAIVQALGQVPVAREPWRDERAMALVAQLRAGDAAGAARALGHDLDTHVVALIGMLGFYQAKVADDDSHALRLALQTMELAAPHMAEPQLTLGIADAYLRLGDRERAATLVRSVLDVSPGMEQAVALLKRIDG